MRVVIDGDSVALYRGDNWPHHFREHYQPDFFEVLSNNSVTTLDVIERLRKVIDMTPDIYFLHLGQWASKNSDWHEFNCDMEYIVSKLHMEGIMVCLITPPPFTPDNYWTANSIRDIARKYNTALLDMHKFFIEDGVPKSWFKDEDIVSHLNETGAKGFIPYFEKIIYPRKFELKKEL